MKVLFGFQLLAGMVLVLLSPALEGVLRTLNVAEQGGGTLYFSYFTGASLSTLSISWLARLSSSRVILQTACALVAAGLWGFSFCGTLFQAGCCFFFVGAANAILVAFPGAILASEKGAGSGKAMTILYTFFALGVMLCPSVCGMLLAGGISWQRLFQAMGVLCALYALGVSLSRLPGAEETSGLRWKSIREARAGDRGLLVGAMLLNVLYVGVETSLIGWVVYYLRQIFPEDADVFRASRVLSFFWLAMILGRLLTALVLDRLGSFLTLGGLILGAAVSWAFALAARELLAVEFLFALTGLFFSGIFPIIASYAGRFPRHSASLAFSLIVAAGGVGGGVVPYLVGSVAEWKSIAVGLASAVGGLVLMLVVLVWLKSRGARV